MATSMTLGLVLVAATFATLLRLMRLKRLLAFGTVIDVVFSAVALAAFAGSFAGLIVATFAGLVMAVLVTVLRWVCGYDYITLGLTRHGKRCWVRKEVAPRFRMPWA